MVNNNDQLLKKDRGIIYYDNVPLSGIVNSQYPDNKQRLAVCINQSRAAIDGDLISMASEEVYYEKLKRETE